MAVLMTSPDAASPSGPPGGSGRRLDVNAALAGLELEFVFPESCVRLDLDANRDVAGFDRNAFARLVVDLVGCMRECLAGSGPLEIRTVDGPPGFVEIELHDTGVARRECSSRPR